MLYKNAFIPFTPLKIGGKEEYYSPAGKRKRKINETLSIISGVGTGVIAGGAIGLIAGKALGKMAPGKMGVSTKRFINLEAKTGFNPFRPYLKAYAKSYNALPAKIPVDQHLPIGGMILGSVAGMFPAEYRAVKRMERESGVEPQSTKREYLKKSIVPITAGLGAGITTGSIIGKIMNGAKNKLTNQQNGYKAIPIISSIGIGLAVENMLDNKLNRR